MCISQFTMTRSWSLLLLALSCQSVDSQNTTRDDVHDDVLLRQEIEALSLRQQQILEQLQIIVKRLSKLQTTRLIMAS